MKIWETNPPGTLWATPVLSRDNFVNIRRLLLIVELLVMYFSLISIATTKEYFADRREDACKRHSLVTLYNSTSRTQYRQDNMQRSTNTDGCWRQELSIETWEEMSLRMALKPNLTNSSETSNATGWGQQFLIGVFAGLFIEWRWFNRLPYWAPWSLVIRLRVTTWPGIHE
jgi:hypothetical protein